MNLIELCQKLKVTADSEILLPSYLLGVFRRKSISFANGLTDEKNIVYWFQSKSFTIDLRLKSPKTTPILERQGWIGDTIWDDQKQLLSWNVTANYQKYIQWPEPAKLHSIGNAIFEFSPSNAYVEDWRQQVTQGLYLGLRLFKIENIEQQHTYITDGGLIICDQFIAFAKARQPDVQKRIDRCDCLPDSFDHQQITRDDVLDFEVSISLNHQYINLSTITKRIGQKIDLEHFEIVDQQTLVQQQMINGEKCRLYFKVDMFNPNFTFTTKTETPETSQNWLNHEKSHLFHHAQVTL